MYFLCNSNSTVSGCAESKIPHRGKLPHIRIVMEPLLEEFLHTIFRLRRLIFGRIVRFGSSNQHHSQPARDSQWTNCRLCATAYSGPGGLFFQPFTKTTKPITPMMSASPPSNIKASMYLSPYVLPHPSFQPSWQLMREVCEMQNQEKII